jgi:hypothetical protein
VRKLGQNKNIVEAIVDAHQLVLDLSKGVQRPLISTSMNGQIYLHQQPATRRRRALAISADDIGKPSLKLAGPPHDVEAIVKTLIDSGFDQRDVTVLRNPDRLQILEAIDKIEQSLRQLSSKEMPAQFPAPKFLTRVAHLETGRLEALTPTAKAPDNTLLLFFFAGHGAQIGNANYIIPKLAMTPAEFDQLDPNRIGSLSLEVQPLTQRLEKAAAASIVILDTHFPALDAR